MSFRDYPLVQALAPGFFSTLGAFEAVAQAVRRATGAEAGGLLARLTSTGVAVVPDFLSAADCGLLRAEVEQSFTAFPDYVQKASNGADRRLYGIDCCSGSAAALLADSSLASLAQSVAGQRSTTGFSMAGIIDALPGNLGSGGGWHRDAFFGQFKAILYLVDVTQDNGPFQYVLGSHRVRAKYADYRRFGIPLLQYRIADQAVEALAAAQPQRLATFPASAGTLILANTSGIHRGKPLVCGQRIALTNYYYRRWRLRDGKTLQRFRPVLGYH